MKLEKAKNICKMYNEGISVSEIARVYNNTNNSIVQYLDRYYKNIYGQEWESFHEKQDKRSAELLPVFNSVYIPFTYTRKEICEIMDCTLQEFEHMLSKYDLTHLRLKTYEGQRTLCNVPNDNYDVYAEYAHKHGMSVRKLACKAINEYILMHNEK